MAKFEPFGEQVVVQPDKREEGESGLIGPGSSLWLPSDDWYAEGTVVSQGEGTYQNGNLIPPRHKPGDKIIYMAKAAVLFKPAGEGLVLVKTSQILGRKVK